MDYIETHHSHFRKMLGDEIGGQMRIVPELNFYADNSLDRADEIDRALKGKGDNPVL